MFNKKDTQSKLLFYSSITLGIFWFGILIFIAKKGGINNTVEIVLFGSKKIKEVLQFKYIPITRQSYIVAFGRYLFPLFILLFSANKNNSNRFRKVKENYYIFLVLPIISLIVYLPSIFDKFFSSSTFAMRFILVGCEFWIFSYIIISWLLVINEYKHISSKYFRKRFLFNILPMFSLSSLFLLYAPQDPAQIFLFYRNDFMSNRGLWYLSKGLNSSVYIFIGGISLLSALIGFVTLFRQVQIQWNEDKEEAVLRQKNITASNGANIFFHGIKNQLIANKILNKRLFAEIEKNNIDSPEILNLATDMKNNNAQMLEKMEKLYLAFKEKEIHFKPIYCSEIVESSIIKFKKKYPNGQVLFTPTSNLLVIGDKTYLSEAFYNILTNGWESELEKNIEYQSPLEIIIKEERTHIIFTFRDFGVGILKNDKKKILEPFFSSKNSMNNWGMGINYTMRIIKNHMGTIRFETIDNITNVDIILPKYRGSN
jgi:signal transduction histidine kinase